MAANVIPDKQQVHELVERLAPSQLSAIRGILEAMLDPIARSIVNAPIEAEEITPETAAELDHASIERGEGISHDDILREFGVMPRG